MTTNMKSIHRIRHREFQAALILGMISSFAPVIEAADAPAPPAPHVPTAPPLVTTVQDVAALPVTVLATDPDLRYLGRFDYSKGDPRCSWTASTVVLKFQGTSLNAQFEDEGRSYWEIEVDGKPIRKMALGTGSHLYQIATNLEPGPHIVRLVRSSEPEWGPTQVHGFQINDGGSLLPVSVPTRRLEIIGDSISCGNDMEGSQHDPENTVENGYFSYGEVAARQLGLDYRCVAWSGRKMWPNKTVPEIYGRTIPTEKDSKWDFSKWIPDVIVINLSTNDFNVKHGAVLDENGWIAAYEKFVTQLRGYYPQAEIYCATSPMLAEGRLKASKTDIQKVVADLTAAGDSKVHYFEFDREDPRDGIGVSNHPNVKTHQIMGNKLAAQLTKDLGWPAIDR